MNTTRAVGLVLMIAVIGLLLGNEGIDRLSSKEDTESCPVTLKEVEDYFFPMVNWTSSNDSVKFIGLSIMFDLGFNNAEARRIKDSAFGVFAKRNITKGEVVTLFPGDIVFKTNETCWRAVRSTRYIKITGPIGFTVLPLGCDHYFYFGNGWGVMGSPLLKDDTNYLGHMVRDAGDVDVKTSYLTSTLSHANCEHRSIHGIHVATVAIRNITKGSELLARYMVPVNDIYVYTRECMPEDSTDFLRSEVMHV